MPYSNVCDSSGKPAPMRFGPASEHLFQRLLQLRSLDAVEFLDDEGDMNIRAFLKRVRDITWHRRVSWYIQGYILGLAPRGASVGRNI